MPRRSGSVRPACGTRLLKNAPGVPLLTVAALQAVAKSSSPFQNRAHQQALPRLFHHALKLAPRRSGKRKCPSSKGDFNPACFTHLPRMSSGERRQNSLGCGMEPIR